MVNLDLQWRKVSSFCYNNNMIIRILIISFLFVVFSFADLKISHAQEYSVNEHSHETIALPNIQHEKRSKLSYIEKRLSVPVEPHFKQVKFLKQPSPKTLSERVDRLIHGLYIDIPPEFDHFGYEIRRHMKSILTPHDLHNTLVLPEKIRNAKTARVILNYWKKQLNTEIKEIEEEIENSNTTVGLRTTFRYNKRIVTSFIPEAYKWIDSNIEFLEYMRAISGEFYVNYPFYQIPNTKHRIAVEELYNKREEALQQIIAYSPFRAMVY